MSRRAPFLLLVIVGLVLAAGTALGLAGRQTADHVESAATFQRLTGGFGFGPTLDLSGCPYQLDPRLGTACDSHTGPVPAGSLFCSGCGRYLFSLSRATPVNVVAPPPRDNVRIP